MPDVISPSPFCEMNDVRQFQSQSMTLLRINWRRYRSPSTAVEAWRHRLLSNWQHKSIMCSWIGRFFKSFFKYRNFHLSLNSEREHFYISNFTIGSFLGAKEQRRHVNQFYLKLYWQSEDKHSVKKITHEKVEIMSKRTSAYIGSHLVLGFVKIDQDWSSDNPAFPVQIFLRSYFFN